MIEVRTFASATCKSCHGKKQKKPRLLREPLAFIGDGVHVHGGVDDFWGVDGDEQSVCAVGRTTYLLSFSM